MQAPSIVIQAACLQLFPLPKCHATLLKRVGLLANGNQLPEFPVSGELAPAMAVHHRFGDPSRGEALTGADQRSSLANADWRRICFVRHPLERLFRLWYFKIFLDDPFYRGQLAPLLNDTQLLALGKHVAFSDFVSLLIEHASVLMACDPHLAPQARLLSPWQDPDLHLLPCSALPSFLGEHLLPRLTATAQAAVRQELEQHQRHLALDPLLEHAADLSSDQVSALETLYAEDLHLVDELPCRIRADIRPGCSSAAELQRAVGHLEVSLRSRHQQLAMLTAAAVPVPVRQNRVDSAGRAAVRLEHGSPGSGLKPLYGLLLEQRPEAVLQALGPARPVQDGLEAERHYLRGLAHLLLADHAQAWQCFELCLNAGFESQYLLFNAANALRGLGRWPEAMQFFDQALELQPDFEECLHNRALTLADQGQLQPAVVALRLLLLGSPAFYQAAFSLANVLRQQGLLAEAIQAYQLALSRAPDYVDAFNNMGLCHAALGAHERAVACYRQGLSVRSDDINCLQNLVGSLASLQSHHLVVPECLHLLSLQLSAAQRAGAVQAYLIALLELGDLAAAQAFVDAQPDPLLRDLYALHLLPVLYDSEEQLSMLRMRFSASLERLLASVAAIDPSHPVFEAFYAHCWLLTNFYLAYQMQDDRALQEQLSSFLAAILSHRLGGFMGHLDRPGAGSGERPPLRIGFVSAFLRNHNGCFWSLAFFRALAEQGDVELFAYNLGEASDHVTTAFARFGQLRQLPFTAETAESVLTQIRADRLDALFFSDVGMHPASKVASLMRLAPVQAVGWGHPVTTGSAAMDYFVTGEWMESEDSHTHYSEALCLLPRTGLFYDPPLVVDVDVDLLDFYRLPADRPLLLSLQSTFKYHPAHDSLYAELSARHPEALIVLVEHMGHPSVTRRLMHRLAQAYAARGLVAEDHLRVLPRLPYEHYVGLFALAHHALDTPDWNGGNSSFQAFAQACPVVSWPGRFMRGRHTVAMLRVLELEELVAADAEAYVAISGRLLSEPAFAARIRQDIAARADRLFRDQGAADAFVREMRRLCGRPL